MNRIALSTIKKSGKKLVSLSLVSRYDDFSKAIKRYDDSSVINYLQ